ncbi:MAG TPA: hypothetical protein VMI54_06355 [Polyangiaceae bacterium]|nr:hypothetical protein [Polyangiaceae bacterium]
MPAFGGARRASGVGRLAPLGCVLPFVVACASGPRVIMGQPIKKQVAVLLHVTDGSGDRFGGIAALADTVTDGLTKRGIDNQLYAADDDHPGTPRIEIWITRWGLGNADLRAAGRGLAAASGIVGVVMQSAGAGEIEMTVKIFREGDTAPACVRKHTGSADPDDPSSTVSAGEGLGSTVLSDALTETKTCHDVDAQGNPRRGDDYVP